MSERDPLTMNRREAAGILALLPFAVAWNVSLPQLERATAATERERRRGPGSSYQPAFFTQSEWETVRMLADYIIPADERSGSASDAKVPEYIDFLMADRDASESSRVAMRGGLGWLDFEAQRRFRTTFVRSTDAQRRAILDDIAWPARARPALSHGAAFFSRFRDLTAAGFFSTAMGWGDVRYKGNVFNPDWNGCPPEAMAKLGVSLDVMKTRVRPARG